MNKVYIVILNYNGWKDTVECLESVLNSTYENYQIIVVDNSSKDGSMEKMLLWAKERLGSIKSGEYSLAGDFDFFTRETLLQEGVMSNKKILFVQSGINGGFAEGNNLAIKYAIKQNDFSYIWLLNNDTTLKEDSLNNLILYAEQNNVDICGSSLFYYHNPSEIQAYGGHINRFWGTSSHILYKEDIPDKLDYIIGASFLINKKVIDKIGLLPEEYFLYYEETDYCFNARNHGFRLGIAIDSIVYHKEGASTGVDRNPKNRSELSDVLSLRNRIIFHRKYLGGGIGLWLGMLIAFFNRLRRRQFSRIYKVFLKNDKIISL